MACNSEVTNLLSCNYTCNNGSKNYSHVTYLQMTQTHTIKWLATDLEQLNCKMVATEGPKPYLVATDLVTATKKTTYL
jgi:hypothetical protein